MTNQNDVLDQLKAGHEAISNRESFTLFLHVIFALYLFIDLLAPLWRYLGMNELLSYAVGIPFYIAFVVWLIRAYCREKDQRNAEFERVYETASSTPGDHS